MTFWPILCAIIAAASAFPQHLVPQQAGAVPAAPTFFFTSPVAAPTVFALTPPALPQPAAAAPSAVAPTQAASAAGAASASGASASAASAGGAAVSAVAAPSAAAAQPANSVFTTTHFNGFQAAGPQPATNPNPTPVLPADLANAFAESNLRLAQAYREAEVRLAAANQKAAQDALHQAIAGASAAAAAGEQTQVAPAADAAAAPATAEVSNTVSSAAPQGTNSGVVLPLTFQGVPFSFVQPFANQG